MLNHSREVANQSFFPSHFLAPDLASEIGDKNVVRGLIDFQLITAVLICHLITRLQINIDLLCFVSHTHVSEALESCERLRAMPDVISEST